jgi:hypothetical protein
MLDDLSRAAHQLVYAIQQNLPLLGEVLQGTVETWPIPVHELAGQPNGQATFVDLLSELPAHGPDHWVRLTPIMRNVETALRAVHRLLDPLPAGEATRLRGLLGILEQQVLYRWQWTGSYPTQPLGMLASDGTPQQVAWLPIQSQLAPVNPALLDDIRNAAAALPSASPAGNTATTSDSLAGSASADRQPLGPSPARHSPDFRSVHWYGTAYSFTKQQAACVKILWEAWENHTPDVGQDTILEEIDGAGNRLADLFRERDAGSSQLRSHPAWGPMICPGGTKGTYRLCHPAP